MYTEYYSAYGISKLAIVKRLAATPFGENFKNLVNYAGDRLQSGALLRSIGFTPHDLQHHCKDIYLILERMIPDAFYEKNTYGENLFVLLTAVLFHDIGMTEEWSEDVRNCHSEKSRDYFLEAFQSGDGDSVIQQNITNQYKEYIADIIYAHSDIKDKGIVKKETFIEICDKYENLGHQTIGESEEINVPFLAALLRLADELDISYERIEGVLYGKMRNLPASLEHFKLCELFKMVQKGNNEYTLVIEVDERKYNVGEEYEKSTRAACVLERYEKICKEFKMMKERVLCNTNHASSDIWKIRKIRLINEDKYIDQAKKKEG